MGLRNKISLIAAGVLAVAVTVGYVGLNATLQPAFDDLEDRASREDLARARHGFEAQALTLSTLTTSFSQWDATYAFMQGEFPEFVDQNIDSETLVGLDINTWMMYDEEGQLRVGLFVDLQSAEAQPVSTLNLGPALIETLSRHPDASSEVSGVVATGAGLMMVSSRPVTTADTTATPNGILVFGRLLDEERIAQISRNAEVDVALAPLGDAAPAPDSSSMFGEITQEVTDTARINSQTIHDLMGTPIAALLVRSGRDVSALGVEATRSATLVILGLGVMAIGVLALLLGAMVIEPIRRTRTMLASVDSHDDVSVSVGLDRNDEIGELATSIDSMLGRLEEMEQQNIEQSFKAGISEVAAGVLHNVRNTLMPVINNVAMAREAMIRRSDTNVLLAIDEIGEPGTDAERHAKLLKFVKDSHQRAVRNRAAAVDYLGDVLDQLDHATEILKEQEKHAHAQPVIEHVDLGEVIDAALGVIPFDVMSGIDIEIQPSARGERVEAHRVSLMQVIGNLLVNAVDSILASGSSLGQITIQSVRVDAGTRVQLTIRDNGAGMSEDVLQRLFDRGFTTKDGSGGLGLHWSANALAGMGAEIGASSEGEGHGAEFRITLQASKPGPLTDE